MHLPEDVIERKETEGPIRFNRTFVVDHGLYGRVDIFVTQHDPFGRARGPARIENDRRVGTVPIDTGEVSRTHVQKFFEIQIPLGADHLLQPSLLPELGQFIQFFVKCKKHPWSGMSHEEFQLVTTQHAGVSNGHGPGFENAEVKGQPVA